ncbi:anthrone oxygenase encC [Aspergillus undulatus]|uniref:anthrone oxygenase encC n=1 Tax=Aspergillus undulatus TaxID=1810928 RepID=UPI003CCD49C7
MTPTTDLIKCTAISGALWLSGKMAAQALVTVPTLLKSKGKSKVSSKTPVQIWRHIYQAGHVHSPPIAAFTSTAFAYLCWDVHSQHTGSQVQTLLYGTAALLVIGIVPYTRISMSRVNAELFSRNMAEEEEEKTKDEGKDAKGKQDGRTHESLVREWGLLTGVRSLLPLTGGLLGFVAAIRYE